MTDALPRQRVLRSKIPLLVEPDESVDETHAGDHGDPDRSESTSAIPDERPRAIFLWRSSCGAVPLVTSE